MKYFIRTLSSLLLTHSILTLYPILCNTMLYDMIRYHTIQHRTTQCSTMQCKTVPKNHSTWRNLLLRCPSTLQPQLCDPDFSLFLKYRMKNTLMYCASNNQYHMLESGRPFFAYRVDVLQLSYRGQDSRAQITYVNIQFYMNYYSSDTSVNLGFFIGLASSVTFHCVRTARLAGIQKAILSDLQLYRVVMRSQMEDVEQEINLHWRRRLSDALYVDFSFHITSSFSCHLKTTFSNSCNCGRSTEMKITTCTLN